MSVINTMYDVLKIKILKFKSAAVPLVRNCNCNYMAAKLRFLLAAYPIQTSPEPA